MLPGRSRASLEQRFREAFSFFPRQGDKAVAALSGGADSVILLHLLHHLRREVLPPGCALEAVHVHHGLSPHAGEWEAFCRDLAASLEIPFAAEHVQVDPGSPEGTEAAARKARYDALARHMDSACPVLITAHHATDQAETVLLALKRGAGLPGLGAMLPVRPFGRGWIFRPLLGILRGEIEEEARSCGLTYVTDESNSDVSYDRNFIRHRILPLLEERFPGFTAAAGVSAGFAAEALILGEQVAEEDLVRCRRGRGLDISALMELSPERRRSLFRHFWHWETGAYPSRTMLRSVFEEIIPARQDAAPQFSAGDFACCRYAGVLYAVDRRPGEPPERIRITPGREFAIRGEHWILEEDPNGVFGICPEILDFSRPFSTMLHPVSRDRGRSLKKIFGELGIPPWQRPWTPLVISGDRILGLFPDLAERDAAARGPGYVFRRLSPTTGDAVQMDAVLLSGEEHPSCVANLSGEELLSKAASRSKGKLPSGEDQQSGEEHHG